MFPTSQAGGLPQNSSFSMIFCITWRRHVDSPNLNETMHQKILWFFFNWISGSHSLFVSISDHCFKLRPTHFLLPYLNWYKFKHMFQQKGLQESAGFFPLSSQTPSKTNVILIFLPMPNASKFSRALRKKGTRQSSNTVTWLVQLVGSAMVVSPPVSSESSSNPLWCFIITGWLPRESWNDFLPNWSLLNLLVFWTLNGKLPMVTKRSNSSTSNPLIPEKVWIEKKSLKRCCCTMNYKEKPCHLTTSHPKCLPPQIKQHRTTIFGSFSTWDPLAYSGLTI